MTATGGVGPAHTSSGATDLLAIERAAARGWPAFETATFEGWLARFSSGGSTRANTVAALDWTGSDLGAAIGRVEAFYRGHGARPRFTISDASQPADLDAELARRGWERGGDHVTYAKNISAGDATPPPSSVTVERRDRPDGDWLAVYLATITESRRPVAPRLVAGVPHPRAFFAVKREGRVVAAGLSVLDGPLASVQCMATLPEARRTGAASAVLAAIEAWAREGGARRLYLQAEGENGPALALYARAGFRLTGRYHTRTL